MYRETLCNSHQNSGYQLGQNGLLRDPTLLMLISLDDLRHRKNTEVSLLCKPHFALICALGLILFLICKTWVTHGCSHALS